MCEAKKGKSNIGTGTETVKTEKSAGYSRQTTRTLSVEDNPKTRFSPSPSIV